MCFLEESLCQAAGRREEATLGMSGDVRREGVEVATLVAEAPARASRKRPSGCFFNLCRLFFVCVGQWIKADSQTRPGFFFSDRPSVGHQSLGSRPWLPMRPRDPGAGEGSEEPEGTGGGVEVHVRGRFCGFLEPTCNRCDDVLSMECCSKDITTGIYRVCSS